MKEVISLIEVIQSLFEAIDRMNLELLSAVFHNEIVYERPGYEPFLGVKSLLKFYKEERVVLEGKHYLEEIITNEHCGACWGRFVGRRKDYTEVDERFADVYIFEGCEIKFRRTHFFKPAI